MSYKCPTESLFCKGHSSSVLSENKKKSTEQTESLNLSDKPQLESDEEKVKEEKRLKNY